MGRNEKRDPVSLQPKESEIQQPINRALFIQDQSKSEDAQLREDRAKKLRSSIYIMTKLHQ
jgi:hypothetical protein